MTPDEIESLLRERAGPDVFLEVAKVDPDHFSMVVLCSYPGRLIGRNSEIIRQLEEDTGWRIRVEAYAVPQDELEIALSQIPSFRRLVPREQGPSKYLADAYFAEMPDRNQMVGVRARLGWQINPVAEGDLTSSQAAQLIAAEKPEAAVSFYVDGARPEQLQVFAVNLGPLIGPRGSEQRRLNRMTGKKLQFTPVADAPPAAVPVAIANTETDGTVEQVVDVDVGGSRCRLCLGRREVLRPLVTIRGLLWRRETCPICGEEGAPENS